MPAAPDPYATLGVDPTASDLELRAAYRRLVQLHHPDHNGGSAESARRFEEVQEAYAQVRRLRQAGSPPPPPDVEDRLAALERELRAAREEAQRRVRRAAEEARAGPRTPRPERPSDEELGYVTTEDSFSKILSDAAAQFTERFDEVRHEAQGAPVSRRVADLIDELGSMLTGEHRPPRGKS